MPAATVTDVRGYRLGRGRYTVRYFDDFAQFFIVNISTGIVTHTVIIAVWENGGCSLWGLIIFLC